MTIDVLLPISAFNLGCANSTVRTGVWRRHFWWVLRLCSPGLLTMNLLGSQTCRIWPKSCEAVEISADNQRSLRPHHLHVRSVSTLPYPQKYFPRPEIPRKRGGVRAQLRGFFSVGRLSGRFLFLLLSASAQELGRWRRYPLLSRLLMVDVKFLMCVVNSDALSRATLAMRLGHPMLYAMYIFIHVCGAVYLNPSIVLESVLA